MKNTVLSLVLIISFLNVFSQTQDTEQEIKNLEQAQVDALLKQDTTFLRKVWAPDFFVNAPINKVVKGGQLKMVAAGFIKYAAYTLNPEQMLIKDNLVISMGSETVVTLGPNYPTAGMTVTRRYTNIWQKQNNHWILIARQASNVCD